MIRFRFDDPYLERELRGRFDALLSVAADLEVVVHGTLLYGEPAFPIVELAVGLLTWVNGGFVRGEPLEFTSAEFQEEGTIWIRPVEGGWLVGSVFQEPVEVGTVTGEAVRDAILAFAHEVKRRAPRAAADYVESLLTESGLDRRDEYRS